MLFVDLADRFVQKPTTWQIFELRNLCLMRHTTGFPYLKDIVFCLKSRASYYFLIMARKRIKPEST